MFPWGGVLWLAGRCEPLAAPQTQQMASSTRTFSQSSRSLSLPVPVKHVLCVFAALTVSHRLLSLMQKF